MTVIDKFPKPLPLQVIMSLVSVTSSFHTHLKLFSNNNFRKKKTDLWLTQAGDGRREKWDKGIQKVQTQL